MLALAREQAEQFKREPMDAARQDLFNELIDTSYRQQGEIEAADSESFGAFLDTYFTRAREPRAARAV